MRERSRRRASTPSTSASAGTNRRFPRCSIWCQAGIWIPYAAAIELAPSAICPVIAQQSDQLARRRRGGTRVCGIDFISMARPFLADAADRRKERARRKPHLVNTCIACNQACLDRSVLDEPVSCMVNPRAGREREFPEASRLRIARRFAVVGGGPPGWRAPARLAALGHSVELFEADRASSGVSFGWPVEFRESAISAKPSLFHERIHAAQVVLD